MDAYLHLVFDVLDWTFTWLWVKKINTLKWITHYTHFRQEKTHLLLLSEEDLSFLIYLVAIYDNFAGPWMLLQWLDP